MLVFIIGFGIGTIVGVVATVFVARNNRAKVERALLGADKASEKYNDYMTKWSDSRGASQGDKYL